MTSSGLYPGKVMHRRLRPKVHQLRYRIFSLLLDLDEIDRLDRDLRWFSRGRLNLLSFHDRDHGDGSATPLRDQVAAHLRSAGVSVGRIRLLAMPRLLGFAFNPLSVYFCEDRAGRLTAILYEVHNTFGERHTYVLPVEDDDRVSVRQDVAKRFHVSPFLPMDLHYSFRVTPPGETLRVAILVADASGPLLSAVHSAERRPLSDATILRAVASHPLMTVKVVAGIAWEAARLLGKGIRVHRKPPAPEMPATIRMADPPVTIARAA